MNWIKLFLGILPYALATVQKVVPEFQQHQKIAAVKDILAGAAQAVVATHPEHGDDATAAANIVAGTLDGVSALVTGIKTESSTQAASPASAPVVTPAISAQINAAPVVVSERKFGDPLPADAPAVVEAPGLHNVVPA